MSDDSIPAAPGPEPPSGSRTSGGAPTYHEAILQRDLQALGATVTRMGALCEQALRDAFRALVEGNRQLAYAVIIRDHRIDALENELGQECLRFLVRHQPAGAPLRLAYGAIRASLELERVGDYAESIARQALKLGGYFKNVPLDHFHRIADLSIPMLRDAVRAFAAQDAEVARQAMAVEETVDALRGELNAQLLKLYRDGQLAWEQLHPLMTVARRLERVSDQARNLCLDTIYARTGEDLKHPGAGTFRVLFVDRHHASLSLMAECIGRNLNESRFVFASAGVEPQSASAATLAFMREKGFDLSRLAPKAITELQDLAGVDVVVTLDEEARRAFPTRPRRFVCLEWPLEDPATATGTEAETRAAYETSYHFLAEHIPSLVEAILGENLVTQG